MTMRAKEYFDERSTREMSIHLKAADLTIKQQLTVTARMMAMEGHEAGLAGQITTRAEQEGSYWTLKFGLGFDEATPADFIRVDNDLNTVEGEGMANPAARFHLWVYAARPDVGAIMHTHPPYISALSTLQEPLIVAHMDQTPFYDDCVFLTEWPGVPIADIEGKIISEALGDKSCIILAHHGYLAATQTVAEACYLSIYLERAVRMQLRASAAGKIKPVPGHLAAEARDFLRKPSIINGTFAYFSRQVKRHYGEDCLLDS